MEAALSTSASVGTEGWEQPGLVTHLIPFCFTFTIWYSLKLSKARKVTECVYLEAREEPSLLGVSAQLLMHIIIKRRLNRISDHTWERLAPSTPQQRRKPCQVRHEWVTTASWAYLIRDPTASTMEAYMGPSPLGIPRQQVCSQQFFFFKISATTLEKLRVLKR